MNRAIPLLSQNGRQPRVDRRGWFRLAAATAAGLLVRGAAWGYGVQQYFTWAQLRYPGVWNPNPRAPARFLNDLRRRTSVEPDPNRRVVPVEDPDLYRYPFLYVAGRGRGPELGPGGESWLRRYIEHGGFVLFDDATGIADSPFARGVETLLDRVFPGRPLAPLRGDHAVFQSFYLIANIPGRKIIKPFLYGIEIEDLTPVVLCVNDLAGAWEGDPVAGFTYPCVPGGERQREMAFRMGVNLALYALTGNYKKDQVHIPFILKRRQR